MLFTIWVIFHVIICIALIFVVLMQSSKGEGLTGSSFGGGISSAVFGGRGAASFLSRATTILAIVFMVNCGALALISSRTRTQQGTTSQTTEESAVTRQAQAEAARQQERQQQQAQPTGQGTTTTPTPAPTTTPAPAGGK